MNNFTPQNRWRSWLLWVGIGAFGLDVLIFADVITVAQSVKIEGLFQRFLELLALAGIINNPTNKTGI